MHWKRAVAGVDAVLVSQLWAPTSTRCGMKVRSKTGPLWLAVSCCFFLLLLSLQPCWFVSGFVFTDCARVYVIVTLEHAQADTL